jgi:hypothetical protein
MAAIFTALFGLGFAETRREITLGAGLRLAFAGCLFTERLFIE